LHALQGYKKMREGLVHCYLSNTAELYPEKDAVTDGQNTLSYSQLVSNSDDLGRFLVKLGVSRGSRVVYFLKRSPECITATIGILKAGGAYVPVDRQTPPDRWHKIITDAAPRAIICDGTTLTETLARAKEINQHFFVVCLGQRESHAETQHEVFFYDALKTTKNIPLPVDVLLDDVAYVMYTSGSTGSPKGVMITHRNIRNYIDWAIEYFHITASDRILGTAPFHFDMSTFDIFCALATGAPLCLATGSILLFPEKLVQFAELQQISLWKGVSSLLMYMSRAGAIRAGRMPSLRTVIFAGEPLASQYLKHWMEAFPDTQFYNGYGPTEATGVSLCYHVKTPPSADQPIPIGKPCKNAKAAVIGDDGLTVNPGEIGELLISGTCLAKGYLNDTEKTRRQFTPPPPGCNLEERVYRTGDLVRQAAEGDYVFVSRKDQQVKWMGYRIELGEIEASLLAHEKVKDAAVILVTIANSDLNELVAITEVEDGFDVQSLALYLKDRLPAYMIPKRFVRLNSIPRTDRGKIARDELLKSFSIP
jgi:D-alanine--poly(phosphoribitol) ligase subunit 1